MRYRWCSAAVVSMFFIGACMGGCATTHDTPRGGAPAANVTPSATELRSGRPAGPREGLPVNVDREDLGGAPAPLAATTVGTCEESAPGYDYEGHAAGLLGVLLVIGSLVVRRSAGRPEALNR